MGKYSRIPVFWGVLVTLGMALPAVADPTTLAGVVYDARLPLKATTVQRKDSEGKPLPVFSLHYAGGDGVDVPAILSQPASMGKGKHPAIILLHGLGGDKNQLQALAMMLNGKGIITVAPDIAGHGDRPRVHGKEITQLDLDETRSLAAQTVQDLRRAVDYLRARPDVDPERIGFVGVSLGGILGARFLAAEPRVRCAVLWAAGGDWGTLITTSAHPWAKAFRDRGQTDPVRIRREMAVVDPVPALSRAVSRPLLFINGDRDDIVPRACSDALIATAKQPKEAVLLPGGHVPNLLEMATRTIAFFNARLK